MQPCSRWQVKNEARRTQASDHRTSIYWNTFSNTTDTELFNKIVVLHSVKWWITQAAFVQRRHIPFASFQISIPWNIHSAEGEQGGKKSKVLFQDVPFSAFRWKKRNIIVNLGAERVSTRKLVATPHVSIQYFLWTKTKGDLIDILLSFGMVGNVIFMSAKERRFFTCHKIRVRSSRRSSLMESINRVNRQPYNGLKLKRQPLKQSPLQMRPSNGLLLVFQNKRSDLFRVLFLGQTLYSHCASLSAQVYKWVPANLLGVAFRWTSIPFRESSNSSRFVLKVE